MQSLLTNLRRAGVDFAADRVIWLGDYVDGGPHTAEVVEAMIAFQQTYPHWEFLKGNHEDELLQSLVHRPDDQFQFANWYSQGGRESLLSYERHAPGDAEPHGPGAAHAVPAAHLAWLEARPSYTESEDFAFVHAGFNPRRATFAENDPTEMLWIRDEFIDSGRDWGKRIIFGHTYFRQPLVLPNKIGINTMHRNGGRLSAVLLHDADPAGFAFVWA